mgnify:CR=1 FL=1
MSLTTHRIPVYSDHPAVLRMTDLDWLTLTLEFNAVLERSEILRRVLFYKPDPSLPYYQADGLSYEAVSLTPHPDITLSIKSVEPSRSGAYYAEDSKTLGFGIIVHLSELVLQMNRAQLDDLLYKVLHEFAHGFGSGLSEVYSTNMIPPGDNPLDQGVSSMEYFADDYWSARPDWYRDPLRTNEGPFTYSWLTADYITTGEHRDGKDLPSSTTLDFSFIPADRRANLIVTAEYGLKEPRAYSCNQLVLNSRGYVTLPFRRTSAENMARVTVTHPDYFPAVRYYSIFDAESIMCHSFPLVSRDFQNLTVSLRTGEGYARLTIVTAFPNTILYDNGWPINAYPHPGYYEMTQPIASGPHFFTLSAPAPNEKGQ